MVKWLAGSPVCYFIINTFGYQITGENVRFMVFVFNTPRDLELFRSITINAAFAFYYRPRNNKILRNNLLKTLSLILFVNIWHEIPWWKINFALWFKTTNDMVIFRSSSVKTIRRMVFKWQLFVEDILGSGKSTWDKILSLNAFYNLTRRSLLILLLIQTNITYLNGSESRERHPPTCQQQ